MDFFLFSLLMEKKAVSGEKSRAFRSGALRDWKKKESFFRKEKFFMELEEHQQKKNHKNKNFQQTRKEKKDGSANAARKGEWLSREQAVVGERFSFIAAACGVPFGHRRQGGYAGGMVGTGGEHDGSGGMPIHAGNLRRMTPDFRLFLVCFFFCFLPASFFVFSLSSCT